MYKPVIFAVLALAVAGTTGCAMQSAPGSSSVPMIRPNTEDGNHQTFYYTGARQSFTVPAGVTSISVVAHGGAGAVPAAPLRSHGRGGRVYAVLPVRAGETLYIYVGGGGSFGTSGAGYNGGGLGGAYPGCNGSECNGYGGGGASDIREGGYALADRVLVAGGGGGSSGTTLCYVAGGSGGGKIGGAGGTGCATYVGGGGGDGGAQAAGGAGGTGGQDSYGHGERGDTGTLGDGGAGGESGGALVCTSSCTYNGAGGGGGGGYYGGGGGGGGAPPSVSEPFGNPGGGGGGGASYAEPKATDVHFWQNWKTATGNGLIVLGWQ